MLRSDLWEALLSNTTSYVHHLHTFKMWHNLLKKLKEMGRLCSPFTILGKKQRGDLCFSVKIIPSHKNISEKRHLFSQVFFILKCAELLAEISSALASMLPVHLFPLQMKMHGES